MTFIYSYIEEGLILPILLSLMRTRTMSRNVCAYTLKLYSK